MYDMGTATRSALGHSQSVEQRKEIIKEASNQRYSEFLGQERKYTSGTADKLSENLGSALCLANLVNTNGTNLCFKPLYPPLEAQIDLVWKKHQILTKPAQLFLQNLQEYLLHNK
jgi:hypothetical protein